MFGMLADKSKDEQNCRCCCNSKEDSGVIGHCCHSHIRKSAEQVVEQPAKKITSPWAQ